MPRSQSLTQAAAGEVIAIFINTHDLDGKRVAGNIQYFDRQHLREFLYTEDPNRNGFLQKFISIKQQQYSNSQIQTLHVNWTRGMYAPRPAPPPQSPPPSVLFLCDPPSPSALILLSRRAGLDQRGEPCQQPAHHT